MTSADRALLTDLVKLADESIQHWATVSNDENIRLELYKALPALHRLLAQEGEGMALKTILNQCAQHIRIDATAKELRDDLNIIQLHCLEALRALGAAAPDAEGETR